MKNDFLCYLAKFETLSIKMKINFQNVAQETRSQMCAQMI
jgi:hypothetical protein